MTSCGTLTRKAMVGQVRADIPQDVEIRAVALLRMGATASASTV